MAARVIAGGRPPEAGAGHLFKEFFSAPSEGDQSSLQNREEGVKILPADPDIKAAAGQLQLSG